MKARLKRLVALAALAAALPAGADPAVLKFPGFTFRARTDAVADMERVFAAELAARGIEVRPVPPIISGGPDPRAPFYAEAAVERTGVTRVRSSGGDSPVTETVSFARCHLGVWRHDGEGHSAKLFKGDVTVPVAGEPPELVPAVPAALAERIAEVLEFAAGTPPQTGGPGGEEDGAPGPGEPAAAMAGGE